MSLKKLLIIGVALLLVYLVFINSVTSHILFSNRSLLAKGFALTEYLVIALFKLAWHLVVFIGKGVQYLYEIVLTEWFDLAGPTYDIRSSQELYLLYQRVERWSGLPWQVFWGIHAEETNLGRNLGAVQVLTVLPEDQKAYFRRICRALHWDANQIYGSHKGAMGPFQFMPETWVRFAVDGNGDGQKDPFNLEDAAYSAANSPATIRSGVLPSNRDQIALPVSFNV
jgi:hypothetical protein